MNGRAYYLMILAKEKVKAAGSLLRMPGVERARPWREDGGVTRVRTLMAPSLATF